MKPPATAPDRLSRVLAEWRVQPPSNPHFRPAVWQRIAQGRRESWPTYLRAHLVGWTVAAGVAVVAAGWAGHTAGRAKLAADREQMVISYLGEIDPRVMAKLRPGSP
ncbi:MAG: hypothetical protein HZA93_07710 [Verrucomicrobia bacterium]|nr:hypothetical protein [Verrucomicrobiota bacterium]